MIFFFISKNLQMKQKQHISLAHCLIKDRVIIWHPIARCNKGNCNAFVNSNCGWVYLFFVICRIIDISRH